MLFYVLGLGAIGVGARYSIDYWFGPSAQFPIHTLLINIVGSLIAGIVFGWLVQKDGPSALSVALITGFCGGFTTFSAFALQCFQMMEKGQWGLAVGYATLSPILCVGAVASGIFAVKAIA